MAIGVANEWKEAEESSTSVHSTGAGAGARAAVVSARGSAAVTPPSAVNSSRLWRCQQGTKSFKAPRNPGIPISVPISEVKLTTFANAEPKQPGLTSNIKQCRKAALLCARLVSRMPIAAGGWVCSRSPACKVLTSSSSSSWPLASADSGPPTPLTASASASYSIEPQISIHTNTIPNLTAPKNTHNHACNYIHAAITQL